MYSNPYTWDEAARHVLDEMLWWQFQLQMKSTREWVGEFRDQMNQNASRRISHRMWIQFGASALRDASDQLDTPPPDLADEVVTLLIRKQRDYGSQNIEQFGGYGLVVRISDKQARLDNLNQRKINPQNESVRDSLLDLIGYPALGAMYDRGWFDLPLVEDVA